MSKFPFYTGPDVCCATAQLGNHSIAIVFVGDAQAVCHHSIGGDAQAVNHGGYGLPEGAVGTFPGTAQATCAFEPHNTPTSSYVVSYDNGRMSIRRNREDTMTIDIDDDTVELLRALKPSEGARACDIFCERVDTPLHRLWDNDQL